MTPCWLCLHAAHYLSISLRLQSELSPRQTGQDPWDSALSPSSREGGLGLAELLLGFKTLLVPPHAGPSLGSQPSFLCFLGGSIGNERWQAARGTGWGGRKGPRSGSFPGTVVCCMPLASGGCFHHAHSVPPWLSGQLAWAGISHILGLRCLSAGPALGAQQIWGRILLLTLHMTLGVPLCPSGPLFPLLEKGKT